MAGKIHKMDPYNLRRFKFWEISTVLDIGAHIGSTAIMAKILNPHARVIALEPCKETFEILERNMQYWEVECHNIAFGPGTPMCFIHKKSSGMNKFVDESEKEYWPPPEKYEYMVDSKTLSQIFYEYEIDRTKPFIIKMDCEGGERYLVRDPSAIDLVRNCDMLMVEIHFNFPWNFGGTVEEWLNLVQDISDTHELRLGRHHKDGATQYIYVPPEELTADLKEWFYGRKRHLVQFLNRKLL
jgi:FkbM family methyltransferase